MELGQAEGAARLGQAPERQEEDQAGSGRRRDREAGAHSHEPPLAPKALPKAPQVLPLAPQALPLVPRALPQALQAEGEGRPQLSAEPPRFARPPQGTPAQRQ